MKEVVKKEILYDLSEAIKILQVRDAEDYEALKKLSNHAIEDVALHKDLDIISITVLIYSIYKVMFCMKPEDHKQILKGLRLAKKNLENNNFHSYNTNIKKLYQVIRHCNAQVKTHLQDVMAAARIKKGTVLLQKGLSLGQAAGLMGLSNWDLQNYAAKTPVLSEHREAVPASKRLKNAFALFGVKL